MCRGEKTLSKKPFRNPKRPRHQNRNEKSIKNFSQAMTNLKKTIILSCVLSASVLPTIKNKYSVEEVYVYYDCHYENKGMKIKDK